MVCLGNKTWVAASLLVLFFLLSGISHGLWRPDEPRVAGTCAEMARTGDFVVPHLNGKPFLEKPPLYYAAGAAAGILFGVDKDVPYRLVSLLFGLLTIITTSLIASKKGGPAMGIIAGGILASTWEFFLLARWIQIDAALVFAVTLAMYAYQSLNDPRRVMYPVILGIAAGMAFMAKGLVGPAIIAGAVLIDIIRRRDIGLIWKMRPFLMLSSMMIPIVPWIIAVWNRGGWPFIREVIVVNNLMRFTGAPEGAALGHQNGLFYYFMHLPGGILPWTLIFIPALIASLKDIREDPYICWFIGPFILFTIASTKRGLYLVPLYPAIACMTAGWLGTTLRAKWENTLADITLGVSILGCFTPFIGIFLGLPLLGTVMGLSAVSYLVFITRSTLKRHRGISLVMIMCMAVFTNSAVYFQYMKPDKDYLGFARQASAAAGHRDINLINPDESLRGVFSMVMGRTCKEVGLPPSIMHEGIYLWAEKNDTIMKALTRQSSVKILMEKNLGQKKIRLTYIVPET